MLRGGRLLTTGLFSTIPFVLMGATGPGQEMLDEYNRILNILIYTAAALAAFSLSWANAHVVSGDDCMVN